MKVITLASLSLCLGLELHGQFVVPDSAFAAQLQLAVPAAMNGNVLDTLHPSVTGLTGWVLSGAGIADLSGIQYFTSLGFFYVNVNPITNGAQYLPPSLIELYISGCGTLDTLPALPNLHKLYCYGNNLSSLPPLSNTLSVLWCNDNPIGGVLTLPNSLHELHCGGIGVNVLPTSLPSSLLYLECAGNQITALPPLPASLRDLNCNNNLLTALPALPYGLNHLSCGNNQITQLPPLPSTLDDLDCQANQLTSLPALPDTLSQLTCRENPLTSLPDLPSFLFSTLSCGSSALTCLPVLPNSLVHLYCSNTNVTCLPNVPLNLILNESSLGFPIIVCNVNTAPCPIQQAAFSGYIFHDDDGDGARDPGEPPFLMGVAQAMPGMDLTAPAPDGHYVLPVDSGTHVLQGRPLLYCLNTTEPATVTLGAMEVDTLRDLGYQMIPGVHDLTVDAMGIFPRQGVDTETWITVRNVGTEPASAEVTFSLDPGVLWVSSALTPDMVTGNLAQWSIELAPWETWSTAVTYHTPYTVPESTIIEHTLTATQAMPDTTPQNNVFVQESWVIHSCDPNDKAVTPVELSIEEGAVGDTLEYLVRFQNVGTAPALRVVITDTLSELLRWNTIELVNTSHTCTWYLHDGVLHVVFDPILLPDSTSDEPASHGAVKFTMRTIPGLAPGTIVENSANIYFDFNEPVITNTATCTVADDAGITESGQTAPIIWPNPASDVLMVTMSGPVTTVDVLDLSGRCVLHSTARGQVAHMDVRSLAPGQYIVRAMSNERIQCARFTKQ